MCLWDGKRRMMRGADIAQLVDLLTRRGVSLFHACQYADFCTYLALGGIPSRALLEDTRLCFTPFATDANDRSNGVWDKVFVNTADFGDWFARGRSWVPNPYGPIVIQLQPAALLEAVDVAVCYRSAGAAGFNREQEAIAQVEEVDRLFLHPPDSGFPRSSYLKPIPQLQALRPGARLPEVSLSVPGGCLPLNHAIVIWTDPYEVGGRSLREWVCAAMNGVGIDLPLWQRFCHEERRALYAELLSFVMTGYTSLRPLTQRAGPALQTWAADILAQELDYQFRRYSRYLMEGTVRPLINAASGVGGQMQES